MKKKEKPSAGKAKARGKAYKNGATRQPVLSDVPGRRSSRPSESIALLENTCFGLLLVLTALPPFFRGLFFEENSVSYVLVAALVFLIALVPVYRRGRLVMIRDLIDAAVFLYAMSYTISLFVAVDFHTAIIGAMKGFAYFAVYWMVRTLASTEAKRALLIYTVIVAGAGVALVTLGTVIGYLHYPAAFENNVMMTTWQYSNAGGIHMAAVVVLATAMAAWAGGPLVAGILTGTAALAATVLLGTASKGAVVVLALGLLLFLILAPGEKKVRGATLSAAALAAGALGLKWFMAHLGEPMQAVGYVALAIGAAVACGTAVWLGVEAAPKQFSFRTRKVIVVVFAVLVLAGLVAAGATWKLWLPEGIAARLPGLTDLRNSSYVTRLDFMRWALYIMGDYPVLGAGAGAWNALYHLYQDYLYWTTETHSHLLQVGVETGILGLTGYIGTWTLFAVAVWRLRKKEGFFPTVAAASLGVIILFFHSCFDFDFSLTGMQLIALALVGTVLAATEGNKALLKGRAAWFPTGLVFLQALAVVLIAARLVIAAGASHQAVAAFAKKDFEQAFVMGRRAIDVDPWSAYYRLVLGRQYITLHSDPRMLASGVELTKQAVDLAPYSRNVLKEAFATFVYAGALDEAEKVAERAVFLCPMSAEDYESLAWTRAHLAAAKVLAGDVEGAKEKALEALEVRKIMDTARNRINQARLSYWYGTPLQPTDRMKLAEAEAWFVLGELSKAALLLDEVSRDVPERPGFAAALLAAQQKAPAESLLKSTDSLSADEEKAAENWWRVWMMVSQ